MKDIKYIIKRDGEVYRVYEIKQLWNEGAWCLAGYLTASHLTDVEVFIGTSDSFEGAKQFLNQYITEYVNKGQVEWKFGANGEPL